MAAKLRLRQMPEDEREREALLSGLTALAGLPRAPIRVVQQEERTEPDGSAEPGSAVGDYHTVAMVRLTAK
jgi:hypothetical protein